jgi:hypothetical protein
MDQVAILGLQRSAHELGRRGMGQWYCRAAAAAATVCVHRYPVLWCTEWQGRTVEGIEAWVSHGYDANGRTR